MSLFRLAVLALAACPTVLHADGPARIPADPVVAPPLPRAPLDYDWTGFHAGVQLGYGDADTSGAVNSMGDGVVGGLHLGYDYDFGNFVLGGEIDYDAADIGLTGGGQIDGIGRLKVRGGFDTGRALIYGTAGVAQASTQIGGLNLDGTGYVAGGGIDYLINDRVTLGGEILYQRFDNLDSSNVDLDALTLRLRAGFRF